MTPNGLGDLDHYRFTCLSQSHFLNQSWLMLNWTPEVTLEWHFIKRQWFSLTEMHLNMSSANAWSFCFSRILLNVSCRRFVKRYFKIHFNDSLKFIPEGPVDNMSTLALMTTELQPSASHHLSQYWPNSLMRICITRPQWVNAKTVYPIWYTPLFVSLFIGVKLCVPVDLCSAYAYIHQSGLTGTGRGQ